MAGSPAFAVASQPVSSAPEPGEASTLSVTGSVAGWLSTGGAGGPHLMGSVLSVPPHSAPPATSAASVSRLGSPYEPFLGAPSGCGYSCD
jgi:hypothetical protein